MAFVRTAVSVSGLGRTSASARVQYVCDFAALMILLTGVVQHYAYGRAMYIHDDAARQARQLHAFFAHSRATHYILLVFGLLVSVAGGMAAFVWVDTLPGPIPFILAAT